MGMQLKVRKRNQVEQLKLDQLEAINRFTQEIKKHHHRSKSCQHQQTQPAYVETNHLLSPTLECAQCSVSTGKMLPKLPNVVQLILVLHHSRLHFFTSAISEILNSLFYIFLRIFRIVS